MGRPSVVVLVVLCAAIAGQISRLGALAPLLFAAMLIVGNVAVLRWRGWRLAPTTPASARFGDPLSVAWLIVILLPVHKFSHRGFSAIGPSLTVESFLEVVAFAGVGLLALVVIRTLEPTLEQSQPPLLLFLFPVWITTTGMWAVAGPYAIVRGAQLVAVALLAWATVALGRIDAAAFDAVVQAVLRWFVRVTLVLIVLGVVFGPRYVSAKDANLDRFTWVGAHPLASGVILSVAAVIALSTPLHVLRLPRWMRALMAATFVVALVPNHSRQSWAGLAVVLLVALGLAGRLTPLIRWIGAPLVGVAAVAGMMFRGPEIWDYLLRNEDSQTLSTGNGRLELWGIGLRALDTPFDWLFGLGHGITRTVFTAEAPWANSAHSSFLAVIVGAGVIGMALFLALVAGTALSLLRTTLWASSAEGFVLTLLFVLGLINGVVSENLAEPNLGFAMLYLIAAAAIVRRATPPTDAHPTYRPHAGRAAVVRGAGTSWNVARP